MVVKELVQVRQVIDAELLTCPDEPRPSADRDSVEDSAAGKLDIAAAGRECRAKLKAVRGLVSK